MNVKSKWCALTCSAGRFNRAGHCLFCRSIASGGLATSTKVKLEQLLSQELFRSMGMEFVFRHVLHRFHSRFVASGEIIFLQGDQICEESPIIILANGKAKVLVDPSFALQLEASLDKGRLLSSPCTSEEGCQCVPMHESTSSLDKHERRSYTLSSSSYPDASPIFEHVHQIFVVNTMGLHSQETS
jgi:hypothetical protein